MLSGRNQSSHLGLQRFLNPLQGSPILLQRGQLILKLLLRRNQRSFLFAELLSFGGHAREFFRQRGFFCGELLSLIFNGDQLFIELRFLSGQSLSHFLQSADIIQQCRNLAFLENNGLFSRGAFSF